MIHRRLMVPAAAALMVLIAACGSDPEPVEVGPTGPTAAELAEQARQDSIRRPSVASRVATSVVSAQASK